MIKMEYFKLPLKKKMWRDFSDLQRQASTFENYHNYANALFGWVKKYEGEINNQHENLLFNNRLDTILKIHIGDYVSESPEILLDREAERIFSERPKHINTLLMIIGNTLWELVRTYTGKDCPSCIDAGLDYVRIVIRETKDQKIALECGTCGYTENIDGSKYTDGVADVYPVNDDDLAKYGVDCKKSFG